MNNKLIDRGAVMIDYLERLGRADSYKAKYEALVAAVDSAPAVDAEPVRHGRWIHCKGKSNLWYCSECGEKIIYNPARKTYMPNKKPVHEVNKRCRNCGAKMDGGADDV